MDLALNNLQRLICHKTQPSNRHLTAKLDKIYGKLILFKRFHFIMNIIIIFSVHWASG